MFKKLIASLTILMMESFATASDWQLLQLDKFSMEAYHIGDLRDPYYPYAPSRSTEAERWRGGMATNFDLRLITRGEFGLFLDNRLHGEGTNRQFRTIGWEYKARLQFGEKFNLYHYHHSRHLQDQSSATKFPLTNTFGGEIVFFKK